MNNLDKGKQGAHRRALGVILLLSAVLYGFIGLITDKELDVAFTTMVFATGTTLLGIGNITDIWKTDNTNIIKKDKHD